MPVKPIPDGYHSVTPYMIVAVAAQALDFYKKAFGAVEIMRLPGPDGKLGHAEIRIGDSVVMLADAQPGALCKDPKALGGSSIGILIYVPDVDSVFTRAVAAGAKPIRPVQNQFYGDRSGSIEDPFGHSWTIATHVEDVTPEEMKKRMDECMKPQK